MSRMNAAIKLAVMIGNMLFMISSAVVMTGSVMILMERFPMLSYRDDAIIDSVKSALLIATLVLLITIYGCCGAVHQVIRKGFCAGRKVLCIHQGFLIFLLAYSLIQSVKLRHRQKSINLVTSNPSRFPRYDNFELKISNYFNNAYFDGVCSQRSLESWILRWVDDHCPPTMNTYKCYLNGRYWRQCDTTCQVTPWNPDSCCPSQDLCNEGFLHTCPYFQCRFEVLHVVSKIIRPLYTGLQAIAWTSALMIMLTILLICYNPRDDIEKELLKTGALTEDDIEKVKEKRISDIEKQKLLRRSSSNGSSTEHIRRKSSTYESNNFSSGTNSRSSYCSHEDGIMLKDKRRLRSDCQSIDRSSLCISDDASLFKSRTESGSASTSKPTKSSRNSSVSSYFAQHSCKVSPETISRQSL